MADFVDPFNKLLEQYVLKVSLQVIDRANTKTQTRLIDLIHTVYPAAGTVEEKLAGQHNQPAATEWEQVLAKAIDHQSVHNQWLICIMRDRARRQETYISQLEETIRFTRQQGLLITNQPIGGVVQLNRIYRNQVILAQQQQHLAGAHRTKQVIADQLSRLVLAQAGR